MVRNSMRGRVRGNYLMKRARSPPSSEPWRDETAEKDNWQPLLAVAAAKSARAPFFRIVSFNVNGIRARVKNSKPAGAFAQALRALKPSLLLLQELKIGPDDAKARLEGTLGNVYTVFSSDDPQPPLRGQPDWANITRGVHGVASYVGVSGASVVRVERDLPSRFQLPDGDDRFRVLTQ
jgi:hypothetical protein